MKNIAIICAIVVTMGVVFFAKDVVFASIDNQSTQIQTQHSSVFSSIMSKIEAIAQKLTALIARINQLAKMYSSNTEAQQVPVNESSNRYNYSNSSNLFIDITPSTSPIYAGQSVTVTVKTTDFNCKIINAKFEVGGAVVAMDNVSPFTYQWTPAVGKHYLKVAVTDCSGVLAYVTKKVSVIVRDGNAKAGFAQNRETPSSTPTAPLLPKMPTITTPSVAAVEDVKPNKQVVKEVDQKIKIVDTASSDCGTPWRKATLTNYTSYPDPGSEECIKYNGCKWEGQFYGLSGKKPQSWVKSNNIAAVHSKDWSELGMKRLKIKQGSKEIMATVYDLCSDADCNGCCTNNLGGNNYLLDLESYTKNRFGSGSGTVEFQVCNL